MATGHENIVQLVLEKDRRAAFTLQLVFPAEEWLQGEPFARFLVFPDMLTLLPKWPEPAEKRAVYAPASLSSDLVFYRMYWQQPLSPTVLITASIPGL